MTKTRFSNIVIAFAAITLTACSGHTVGVNRINKFYDFGDVRVEISNVWTTRDHNIPNTKYFIYSWSPQGYERVFQKNAWRQPTNNDWQAFLDMRLKHTDWTRYPSPDKGKKSMIKFHKTMQKEHEESQYKARVRSDGFIVRDLCAGTVSGRHHCPKGLNVNNVQRLDLAKRALKKFDPSCKIERLDPPELTAIAPQYKSGSNVLIAVINCK
jgi:hypothetical protein